MKYKVGDKVRIKSIDWYNENKDEIDQVDCGSDYFISSMVTFCGQVVTISSVQTLREVYDIKEDGGTFEWTDEMIEGLVEEETKPKFKVGDIIGKAGFIFRIVKVKSDRYIVEETPGINWTVLFKYQDEYRLVEEETKPNIIEEAKTYWDSIKDAWICPQGYQFKDENGNIINAQKIVLEKKEKMYPKTYEECCKVLDWNHRDYDRVGYKSELLCKFQVLLLCRDAYWRIAGEEMGLGKPWEYDCHSEYFTPAIIYRNGFIQKVEIQYRNAILTFPTEEMRDAFYENFKELIEICKELLQ